ncbi:Aste57867_21748 [Aphanomyces stellatus]|uniref:Aste57867_21748 protein n=1 Tax=Aphanomyces stellatus TaxID=120398 RepID=A0A485LJ00_9STRA|nr:hypothetical protein As57867_021679 [Aphanomyces stellatus]VFT98417.1 Aste57867_21748 [Aphanomyces stellatus]
MQQNVLGTRELVAAICAFQAGIPHDVMTFRQFKCIRIPLLLEQTCHLLEEDVASARDPAIVFAHVHAVLRPWLDTHGTTRLPLLFASIPHMQTLVPLYSVYVHDIALQSVLALQFPPLFLHPSVLRFAAKRGSIETLTHLHSRGYPPDNDMSLLTAMMSTAAKAGHVHVVAFAIEAMSHDVDLLSHAYGQALVGAATHGHAHALRVVLPHCRIKSIALAIEAAARGHHHDALQALVDESPHDVIQDVLRDTCEQGQVDVATFLVRTAGHRFDVGVYDVLLRRAIRHGRTAMASLLLSACPTTPVHVVDVYEAAIRHQEAIVTCLYELQPATVVGAASGSWREVTLLHVVMSCDNVEMVRRVLEMTQPSVDDVHHAIQATKPDDVAMQNMLAAFLERSAIVPMTDSKATL